MNRGTLYFAVLVCFLDICIAAETPKLSNIVTCNLLPFYTAAKEARKSAEEALSKSNHKLALTFFTQLIGHLLLSVCLSLSLSLSLSIFIVFNNINLYLVSELEPTSSNYFKRASSYLREKQYEVAILMQPCFEYIFQF